MLSFSLLKTSERKYRCFHEIVILFLIVGILIFGCPEMMSGGSSTNLEIDKRNSKPDPAFHFKPPHFSLCSDSEKLIFINSGNLEDSNARLSPVLGSSLRFDALDANNPFNNEFPTRLKGSFPHRSRLFSSEPSPPYYRVIWALLGIGGIICGVMILKDAKDYPPGTIPYMVEPSKTKTIIIGTICLTAGVLALGSAIFKK